MRTIITSVSAVALAVAMGGAAMAQSSTGTTDQTGTSSSGAAMSGTTAQAGQSMNQDKLKDTLSQVGFSDTQRIGAQIIHAESPEGQPVVMIVAPHNLQGNEVQNFDKEKVQSQLQDAGFQNITFASNAQLLRASKTDQTALAFSGNESGGKTGSEALNADKLDKSKLKDNLGQAGIDDVQAFNGKILRPGMGSQAGFVLIGPKGFEAGQSVELSSNEKSQLDQQGMNTMGMSGDIVALQGKLGDNTVLILSGNLAG